MTIDDFEIEFPHNWAEPNFPWRYLFKTVDPKRLEKKKSKKLCKHWGCSRPVRKMALDCTTCNSRKQRMLHPVRHAWKNLKMNAERRGVEFELTLDQFRQLVGGTDWYKRRGRENTSLTVDRIDPNKGYVWGNVRLLTHETNSRRPHCENYEAKANEESELFR